jgi:hypothetical protein
MPTLLDDLTHSLRQLRRKPIFTATAVLTLAIGMGVNTVAFSVVNGMLFKGFAVKGLPGSGRILTTPGSDEEGNASIAEFGRFREATRDALEIAAEGRSSVGSRNRPSPTRLRRGRRGDGVGSLRLPHVFLPCRCSRCRR